MRVAVIGAGFSGLAFARAVQQANLRNVVVFEQTEALDNPQVSGDIRVPAAEAVLDELGLAGQATRLRGHGSRGGAASRTSSGDDDGARYPQQGLQMLLARSLRPGTLRLSCSVERLERSSNGAIRLSFCARGKSEALLFDLCVCAHGQLQTVALEAGSPSAAVALIGDARWVRRRRWDLGTARRAGGANTALLDAVDLARLVHRAARIGQRPDLGRYAAAAGRSWRCPGRAAAALAPLVAAVLLAVWFGGAVADWCHLISYTDT